MTALSFYSSETPIPTVEDFQQLLHPLTEFSGSTQEPDFRDVESLEGAGNPMPEPYRSLLVHETDMTSTLETFFRERPRLEVLSKLRRGSRLYRQVLLRGVGSGRVMEYGAIRIQLDVLGSEARFAVLEGSRPLGGVLGDFQIRFVSRPQNYFSIRPGAHLQQLLGMTTPNEFQDGEPNLLFGRKNFLETESGDVLAEVVEILPPVTGGR